MPGFRTVNAGDGPYGSHLYRWNDLLRQLQRIREVDLNNYTDLPLARRLYVEDIDSFRKVRDVNPDQVRDRLDANGILQISEDEIQQGLELILESAIRCIAALPALHNLHSFVSFDGVGNSVAVNAVFKAEASEIIAPIVCALRAEGLSLSQVADRLTERGETTRTGKP